MDSFGRWMEILVTAVLLFFVPLTYLSAKNDLLCQTYVTTETSCFVDSVRNIGFVDRQMYDEFLRRLSVTGIPYEIQMSHYKAIVGREEDGEGGAPDGEASFYSYYRGIYGEDMRKEVMEGDKYLFQRGDFFSVVVRKQGPTWDDRLRSLLLGRELPFQEVQVVYGGAIRDEIR